MLEKLVRKFIKNPDDVRNREVREAYGTLAGMMGIAINLLLFGIKLPIGYAMGSIAVVSDAFNNLSDMGSSLISVVSARMSGRRPDREHPFGHGRVEYVSALLVAILILFVAFELFKESFDKLLNPQPVEMQWPLLILFSLAALAKVWMYYYNKKFGEKIDSSVMRATARDSLSDVVTSVVVVGSAIAGRFTTFPVDSVAGLGVSILIFYNGYTVARDTINLLLGGMPDPQIVREISRVVESGEGIVGIHDMVVHDYGPGRVFASVHAEVPEDANFVRIHETIDALEQRVLEEQNITLSIHMDPVSVHNEKTNALREQVTELARAVNPRFTIHDFRITDGENRVNMIFDVVMPCEMKEEECDRAAREIAGRVKLIDPKYRCVIRIDTNYAIEPA